jgi:hypothetical protein
MPEFELDLWYRPKLGSEAVVVWGEALLKSQEVIKAEDLDLITIKNLVLTPVTGKYAIDPHAEGSRDTIPWPTKYIWKKGEPMNEATVYLWDDTSTEHDGSVWLNFIALGE